MENNNSPRSSQIISPPIVQQIPNKETSNSTGNLLDIEGEKSDFERSISSDKSDITSSIGSHKDLLEHYFDSNSQNNPSTINLLTSKIDETAQILLQQYGSYTNR